LSSISENDAPVGVGDRAGARVEAVLANLARGEVAAAESQLDSAERIFDRLLVAETPSVADRLVARGRISLSRSDTSAALGYLRRADAYWTAVDPNSRWSGVATFWLARCYERLGRTQEALAAQARAVEILSASRLPIDAQLLRTDEAGQVVLTGTFCFCCKS
jgi:tetratricopeptide (TPR) repeat protein